MAGAGGGGRGSGRTGGARRGAAVVLIVLAAPAGAAAAAARGTVGGRVVSRQGGAPVAAARVTLEPRPGADLPASFPAGAPAPVRYAAGREILTDASGAFLFDDVPPGQYVLGLAAARYTARIVPGFRVEAGSELRLDLDLEPALEERITVRGGRDEDGAGLSRTVLGRDALESRPGALGDPFRALAGRAGIVAQDDFRSEMRLRGGEASETAVLLDGLPLPYPHHFGGGAGSASALSLDLVESVEVLNGGFSVEHGDALAGVIAVSSRDAPPARAAGSAGIGTMLAHAALAGPAGDGSWLASARLGDLGLYHDRIAGDGTEGVAFHDLFGAVRMALGGGARLEVAFLAAGNDYEADLGEPGRAAMTGRSRGLRARIEAPLDSRTLLRVQAGDSSLVVDSDAFGGTSFAQVEGRRDLKVSLLRLLGESHGLHGGVALARSAGGMEGAVHDGSGLRTSALDFRDDVVSLFVEDTWRPDRRLTMRYGARADRSSWTGTGALSPRLEVEARPREGLALRAAAGRFVQYPRQEQVFLAAGGTLARQIADHFVAGFETTSRRGTRLALEGFRKRLQDPIGETVNRHVEMPELLARFDRGAIEGAELTIGRSGAMAWTWEAAYGYLVARQTKDGRTYARNTDQRHSLALSAGRRFGRGWEGGALFRYSSGLPYTPLRPWTDGVDYAVVPGDLNAARLPAYHRLDLHLSRTLPSARGLFSVRLDLLNVYNHANVRAVDLSFEPDQGAFFEKRSYQSPLLPVLGLAAEF